MTGRGAVATIDPLVRAEKDQTSPRTKNAQPLAEDSSDVVEILQKMRAEDKVHGSVCEPDEARGIASELYRAPADFGIRRGQIHPDRVGDDRIPAES